jgi:phosphoglycerate dehydrogenase-like enzyme
MRVIGVRRSGGTHPAAERVATPDRLVDVAREADYLVVTSALTPQTRGLVSREVIAAMKPTAWLVNIARGAIVDEDALLEALRAKRIGGAAIDAWWQEPMPEDSPWWGLDNVIVTPHRSYSSPRLPDRTLALFGENLRRFRAGEPLLNVVDKRLGY